MSIWCVVSLLSKLYFYYLIFITQTFESVLPVSGTIGPASDAGGSDRDDEGPARCAVGTPTAGPQLWGRSTLVRKP